MNYHPYKQARWRPFVQFHWRTEATWFDFQLSYKYFSFIPILSLTFFFICHFLFRCVATVVAGRLKKLHCENDAVCIHLSRGKSMRILLCVAFSQRDKALFPRFEHWTPNAKRWRTRQNSRTNAELEITYHWMTNTIIVACSKCFIFSILSVAD